MDEDLSRFQTAVSNEKIQPQLALGIYGTPYPTSVPLLWSQLISLTQE